MVKEKNGKNKVINIEELEKLLTQLTEKVNRLKYNESYIDELDRKIAEHQAMIQRLSDDKNYVMGLLGTITELEEEIASRKGVTRGK